MQASMNLFKGYMGVGILALPASFNQAGYVLSSIILLSIGIISYNTINLLFKITSLYSDQNVTYETIAEKQLGYNGLVTIKVLLFIFQGGCCVSYIIFFVTFFESAFSSAQGSVDYDLLYTFLALLIIMPLTMIDNIKTLSKFSTLANSLIILTLFCVMGFEAQILYLNYFGDENKINVANNINKDFSGINKNFSNWWDFQQVPMMFGIAIYSFEAIGVVFTIRNSMEKQKEFDKVYLHSNFLIAFLFISFSIMGVLAFGQNMKDIILFALPNDSAEIKIFQISYAIALALTYPLQIIPVFRILEDNQTIKSYLMSGVPQNNNGDQSSNNISENKIPVYNIQKQFVVRLTMTLLFCTIALFVPTFASFLNAVGGVAGTSLQFLFPVIILNYNYPHLLTKSQRYWNLFYFSLGSFVVVFTIKQSLNQIFQYNPYL